MMLFTSLTNLCCSNRLLVSSLSLRYWSSSSCSLYKQRADEFDNTNVTSKLILEFPSCFFYLWSISCFISMPCFSRSSLWAKAQSTGSIGVSAQGVRSRSWRACSGWLKRNTWLLPKMIRFPTKVLINTNKLKIKNYNKKIHRLFNSAKTYIKSFWNGKIFVRLWKLQI